MSASKLNTIHEEPAQPPPANICSLYEQKAKANESAQEKVKQLKQKLKDLQYSLDFKDKAISNQKQYIQSLQISNKFHEREMEKQTKIEIQLKNTQAELKQKADELLDKKSELQQKQTELEQKQAELCRKQEQIQRLQNSSQAQQAKIRQLRQESVDSYARKEYYKKLYMDLKARCKQARQLINC